jgi:sugar lactone lactonase YvrE
MKAPPTAGSAEIRPMSPLGRGLQRPECVVVQSGRIWTSDRRGVAATAANGRTRLIQAQSPPTGFLPNGITCEPGGGFLIADLGDVGGIWSLDERGMLNPWLQSVDGVDLGPTNFVTRDGAGRVWVTVSTRRNPRWSAFRPDHGDGYIVLVDERGARVVADGLFWTNEALVDPSGRWLYVNETTARRTSRFRIGTVGDLGPRETFAQYGAGTLPDGLGFDAEGGVWVVSVGSNRLIRINAEGAQQILFEDFDAPGLAHLDAAFDAGRFEPHHLDCGRRGQNANLSSLAFGGQDLRTLHLGSLAGEHVVRFRVSVSGAP